MKSALLILLIPSVFCFALNATNSYELISAPFTPMYPNGSVNFEAIAAMASRVRNINAVFVGGTTGESVSLTTNERMQIAAAWVSALKKSSVRVIVHVGASSLADTQALAAHAQSIGAAGIGSMAPFFFHPATLDDLISYMAAVAGAAPRLPFYYYHIPSMTGTKFPARDFLARAGARIPTLAGLKFTDYDMLDYGQCIQTKYQIYIGKDELFLWAALQGSAGGVGSTYNFASPLYARMFEAWRKGDQAQALEMQNVIIQMITLFTQNEFASYATSAQKAIMGFLGLDIGVTVRPPLPTLSAAQVADLQMKLKAMRFFDYVPPF